MKVAVTGASGHVGANLCPLLIEKGFEVNVLSFRDDRAFRHLPLTIFKGDLNDPSTLDAFLEGADVVINTAAYISVNLNDDNTVYSTNVNGTRNLVSKCMEHHVKRLIHFSSIHAFNPFPLNESLDEERPLAVEPEFIYDRSKADSEKIIRKANCKTLETVVLNPTSIIGPGDHKPSLIGRTLLNLYHKKLPALVRGGYDFVDVRDVAQAAVNAITLARAGEKYLLSGKWHSIREFGDTFSTISGIKRPWFICPLWLAKAALPVVRPFLNKEIRVVFNRQTITILAESNRNISSAKARKELEFKNRNISESIGDALHWFKENSYL
ncbi:MAG TPA: NAD-dependent epimerase/dehydratase family protein [Bacteroidales bacterium]|nr:NAD-dependent epimerase/dehydratase family protein [Bacteroidales bacterium]